MIHLLKIFKNSRHISDECVFYMDSEETVALLMKFRLELDEDIQLVVIFTRDLIKRVNIYFKHIERIMNTCADDLAK